MVTGQSVLLVFAVILAFPPIIFTVVMLTASKRCALNHDAHAFIAAHRINGDTRQAHAIRSPCTALEADGEDLAPPAPFMKLPIAAIQPRGWLRHQLELEASGMIGRLSPLRRFTLSSELTPTMRRSPKAAASAR